MHALKFNPEMTQDTSQNFIPHRDASSTDEVLKGSRSNFRKSFGLLERQKALDLKTYYAFCRIIDDCVDELSDPDEQNAALNFWQSELDLAYLNTPRHAYMKELTQVINRYDIPKKYLLDLITGCRLDAAPRRYATFEELYNYCYHVAGVVGLTCLKIFDYHSPTAEKMAVDLGIAFQLTNIIRDVGEDLGRGRIYLPADMMAKYAYTEADLRNRTHNDAFGDLMRDLCRRIIYYYHAAFDEFALDNKGKLVAAQAMARTYQRLLKKIIHADFPVLKKRVKLNFLDKLILLFEIRGDKRKVCPGA